MAAVGSALLSIVCCLPFALPAALGVAGLGAVVGSLRPWMTAASLVLLAIGLVQLYRKRACGRESRASLVLFGASVLIVLAFLLFPQVVATVLADLT